MNYGYPWLMNNMYSSALVMLIWDILLEKIFPSISCITSRKFYEKLTWIKH